MEEIHARLPRKLQLDWCLVVGYLLEDMEAREDSPAG